MSPLAEIALTSPVFEQGGRIPYLYTCEGDDISPPLQWSGAPVLTRSYALICEDPDAPRGFYVHWVLYNISKETVELARAVPTLPELPSGARHGRNTAGDLAYAGPCPPPGKPHRYFFRLYALREPLQLADPPDATAVHDALKGREMASGTVVGTFAR